MTTPGQQLPPGAIDAEQVARHLGQQIGVLSFELAARDVALEMAQREIAELRMQLDERQNSAAAQPPADDQGLRPPPVGGPPADELPTTIVPAPPEDPPGKRRSAVAEASAR